MTIRKELLDELLASMDSHEDFLGPDGLFFSSLAMLSAPSLAQSSIVRTRVELDSSVTARADFPGVTSSWSDNLSVGASAVSRLAELPPLPELELVSVRVRTRLELSFSIAVAGLDAGGTLLSASRPYSYFSADPTFQWGPLDFVSLPNSGTIAGPIGPGELVVFEVPVFPTTTAPFSRSRDDFGWSSVLASPLLTTSCSLGSLSINATQPDGTPVDVAFGSVERRASVNTLIEVDVELEQQPSVVICPSTLNSSGNATQLEVYGSLRAGEDWLSVEATGLPANQLGVLFTGTALDVDPAANYTLCVGGQTNRVGGNRVSDGSGSVVYDIELFDEFPGQPLYIQLLHRDPVQGIQASDCIIVNVE